MKISTIQRKYGERLSHYRAEKERLKAELEAIEKTYPGWIESIIEPIARKLVKMMPDRFYEIFGPFGLTCETSIHFYTKSAKSSNRFKGDNCISITFRPGDLEKGEIFVVDRTVNKKRYKPGTIGEMNGGNYDTIPMKETVEELLTMVK